MDVTDPDGVRTAIEEVARHIASAGLRAVVNNAGLIISGPVERATPEQLRWQFEVNVFGAGARPIGLLAGLPDRVRDRAVAAALGLPTSAHSARSRRQRPVSTTDR